MQGLTAVSPAWSMALRWRGSGGGLGDVGLGLRRCTAALGCSGEVLVLPRGLGVEEEAEDAPGAPGSPWGASERRGQEVDGSRVWVRHGEGHGHGVSWGRRTEGGDLLVGLQLVLAWRRGR